MDIDDTLKAALLNVRVATLNAIVSGMNAENQRSINLGLKPEFEMAHYRQAINDCELGENDITIVMLNHLGNPK